MIGEGARGAACRGMAGMEAVAFFVAAIALSPKAASEAHGPKRENVQPLLPLRDAPLSS